MTSPPIHESISFKQVRMAVLVVLILGIFMAAIQIFIDWRKEREVLDQSVNQLLKSLNASAAQAAYGLDNELADRVTRGLFEYRPVFRAMIVDDLGETLSERHRPRHHGGGEWLADLAFGDLARYEHPLQVVYMDQPVGRLSLEVDTYLVALGFSKRILFILVSGLTRNLLLAFTLLLLFHRMLTRPLLAVNEALLKTDPGAGKPIEIPIPAGHETDELGLLSTTMGTQLNRFEAVLARQKETEKHLRESEEKFRGLFENINEAAALHEIITDENNVPVDFVFLEVNPAYEHVTKLKAAEIIGKRGRDVIPIIEQKWIDAYGRVAQTGRSVTIVDHSEYLDKYWEVRAYSPQKNRFAIAMTDITERKRVEKEIIQQKQKAERYLNLAGVMFIGLDLDGKVTLANDRACRILECDTSDIVGTDWFADFIPQSAREEVRQVFAQLTSGTVENVAYYENPVLSKKGGEKIIAWNNTCLTDDDGTIVGVLGSGEDITEKRRLEARLQRVFKMESIASLAGGIAHDFNNILSPIIGMAELLMEDLPADSREHENARVILNAGKRGSDLVKQILAFSRGTEHRMVPVRVQQILKEVLKLARSTIPSDIDIVEDIRGNFGPVNADPTQLHQIAMNLITNAYHAVEPTGGKITVRLTELPSAPEDDDVSVSGPCLVLSISDTGTGIPPSLMDKIFEPYFTTKAAGKGTGLGLAVTYGIVKDHRGDIKVFSEPGNGTIFNVYLPLMETPPEMRTLEPRATPPSGNERILLVDDEESIVNLLRQGLRRLGYRVTACLSSTEALSLFSATPDAFDLVITDMTMPHLTGDYLTRKLIAIRPDIPVIICTGFSERINEAKAKALGVKGYLMKPVVKSEMAGMIRRILDESKGAAGIEPAGE